MIATQEVRSVTNRPLHHIKFRKEGIEGCGPEGRRGVGDCAVEVGGEGDHVGEEARQGAEQGEGGEEER